MAWWLTYLDSTYYPFLTTTTPNSQVSVSVSVSITVSFTLGLHTFKNTIFISPKMLNNDPRIRKFENPTVSHSTHFFPIILQTVRQVRPRATPSIQPSFFRHPLQTPTRICHWSHLPRPNPSPTTREYIL